MRKKRFALIGQSLSHTISPLIHNQIFKQLKINADYKIIDINPDQLQNYMPYLNQLDGYNVTIPYKQKIIPYLDGLSNKAKLCGSVNTVKNGDCSIGYTTDAYGFTNALKSASIPLNGRVVILGYGGVARVIAFECCLYKCSITLAVREKSIKNAFSLQNEIKKTFDNISVDVCPIDKIKGHIDLLVNATPVGMYPNVSQSPVNKDVLKNCSHVLDTIYNPPETKLMHDAIAFGCNVSGGLNMLISQAIYSEFIWNEKFFLENY